MMAKGIQVPSTSAYGCARSRTNWQVIIRPRGGRGEGAREKRGRGRRRRGDLNKGITDRTNPSNGQTGWNIRFDQRVLSSYLDFTGGDVIHPGNYAGHRPVYQCMPYAANRPSRKGSNACPAGLSKDMTGWARTAMHGRA